MALDQACAEAIEVTMAPIFQSQSSRDTLAEQFLKGNLSFVFSDQVQVKTEWSRDGFFRRESD